MAKQDFVVGIDADIAKGLTEIGKFTQGFEKLVERIEKIEHSGKKAQSGLEGINIGMVKGFAGALGLVTGVNEAISKGIDLIRSYAERLDKLADKRTKAGAGLVSLAMLQPAGHVTENINTALSMTAQQGALGGPNVIDDAAKLYALIQSAQPGGDFEKAKPEYLAALSFSKIIGSMDVTGQLASVGQTLKIPGSTLFSGLIGAAAPSAMTEIDLARAATTLPLFNNKGVMDPMFGLAAMSGIASSGMVRPEALRERMEALSRGLLQPNKFNEKIKGYEDMPLDEKWNAVYQGIMQKHGSFNVASLAKEGFKETEVNQAFLALASQGGQSAYGAFKTMWPNITQQYGVDSRLKQIQEDPRIKAYFEKAKGETMAAIMPQVSPQGEMATTIEQQQLAAGATNLYGPGVDTETGKATRWRTFGWPALRSIGTIYSAVNPSGIAPGGGMPIMPGSAGAQMIEQAMKPPPTLEEAYQRAADKIEEYGKSMDALIQSNENLVDAINRKTLNNVTNAGMGE